MISWFVLLLLLAIVALQDFRSRTVYAWVFPTLAVVAISHSLTLSVFSLAAIAANLVLVLLQMVVLNLVLCLRTGKRKWLMAGENWIGWGDIAFFAVAACIFSTVNFMFVFAGSLMIVLLGAAAARAWGIKTENIPLAGAQAVVLIGLLLLDVRDAGKSLYEDVDLIGVFLADISRIKFFT